MSAEAVPAERVLSRSALEGRVALVTGGGRPGGIGAATARVLAEGGAAVAVCDLARPTAVDDVPVEQGAEVVADNLVAAGHRAVALTGDVTREDDCAALVNRCVALLGGCDILVNNAAAPHGADRAPIEEVPASAFDAQVAVNVRGAFLMARAAVPHLRARGWGRVVNIASLAAIRGFRERAAYSASKAAVIGLTHALAAELAPVQVTVNAVCPGIVLTPRNVTSISRDPAAAPRSPLGRPGEPEDVAGAVALLCTDLASFVTGQVLTVDGGLGTVLTSVR